MCKNVKKFLLDFGGAFLTIITLIGFWAIFKSFKTAIIATIPVFIFSLVVAIIKLIQQTKRLQSEKREIEAMLEEEKNKNTALASQYRKKQRKLQNYEIHWAYLNSVFLNAIQGSKKERFEEAFNLYNTYSSYLRSDEED